MVARVLVTGVAALAMAGAATVDFAWAQRGHGGGGGGGGGAAIGGGGGMRGGGGGAMMGGGGGMRAGGGGGAAIGAGGGMRAGGAVAPSMGARAAPGFPGNPGVRGFSGPSRSFSGGNFAGGNRFAGSNWQGNRFAGSNWQGSRFAGNNWRGNWHGDWRHGRHFRNVFPIVGAFAYSYPYYADSYYGYDQCAYVDPDSWWWRQYCAPYGYGGYSY